MPFKDKTGEMNLKVDSPRAGDRKVETVDGIAYAFRWCPPGEFMMGSPEDEPGRADDETQHRVKLTKGFWMLETPVTQAMWLSVMGENPSEFEGERNPVENVSWDDCQEFCRKLSLKLGDQSVRLPTEAQWEYACRAGSTTALPNGPIEIKGANNAPELDPIAWYGGNSSQGFTGSSDYDSREWDETQYLGGPCGTHPVGQKAANAWGLYDMIGNVWEWCSDYYDAEYYGKSPICDPENQADSLDRVFRGGSWDSTAEACRSALRFWSEPDDRDAGLGFRVVLVPGSPN